MGAQIDDTPSMQGIFELSDATVCHGFNLVVLVKVSSKYVHRDSERQLHFDTKFEHEEMVLVA